SGGQFQDYPPVSGTDDTTTSQQGLFPRTSGVETLGPQVNGFPVGYYDAAGTEDIDFHDNTGEGVDPVERNQYRRSDRVGTLQGTKGGGFDTPRPYRRDLTNVNGGTSYVPDYIVAGM